MLYRIITMGILRLSLTVCTYGNPLLNAPVWQLFRYSGEQARSYRLPRLTRVFFKKNVFTCSLNSSTDFPGSSRTFAISFGTVGRY